MKNWELAQLFREGGDRLRLLNYLEDPGDVTPEAFIASLRTRDVKPILNALPAPAQPNRSVGEQWAHLAVEIIFERAPEAIQAKVMDILEEWAGKFGAPPSPMKSLDSTPAPPGKRIKKPK